MSHAAEADGSHRHCDHREQERGHGVSTGEHLRLSEEWNCGDGRSENDPVVDEVPHTQHALEVRLTRCPR